MLRDRSRGRVAGSGSKGYGDRERRGVVACVVVWGTRYCWEWGGGDLGKNIRKWVGEGDNKA